MVELRGGMADPRRDLRDAEAKASDAMILGGEDSVAAGQMNGGVQYIVRAVPKGRARRSPGAETRAVVVRRACLLRCSFSFSGV